ncbi:MAG: hypothetical protein M1840_006010 [Geoglossum simile]|nr:MAG: hypothetical protein M1840_006010 [Geoglossum simile]
MALTSLAPPLSSLLLWFALLVVAWLAGVTVYRLFLHPLAHIPGPRIAACTYVYSFYFNVIVGGSRFYIQIEQLHRKYGPVVRITPDEVHLSDPENHGKIYQVGTKFLKSPGYYGSFGIVASTFGTIDAQLHRVRRAAISPRLSRKMVLELEGVVQSKTMKLCCEIADRLRANRPVDIFHDFRAVTIDIITYYAFDNCYNLLNQADFGWPLLQSVVMKIPMWLARRLNKAVGTYMQMLKISRDQVVAVKATVHLEEKPPARVTVFHELLRPDAMEGCPSPSVDDFVEEAMSLIGAGSETTGNTFDMTTYYVLSSGEIYDKLTTELEGSFPDPSLTLDFVTLEKLPYLTAVIKEGLRLSYGVIGRLPRVTPQSGAVFNGYTIPPGSIVGMSAWMMNRNESIFPDPDKFDPSRWLEPESAKILDRHLASFSKGTRQCAGMNLAYYELYVILGTFFRRFGQLEIDSVAPGYTVFEDYFAPQRPQGSVKLHVASKVS